MSFCEFVELRFYDVDRNRLNVTLPEARSISFTEELKEDGGATFNAARLANALQVDPDVLENGICAAAMVLTSGANPTEVFAWELVPTSGTIVAEPGQQDLTSTAPGLRHLFDYAVLHTEVGSWDKVSDDARLFGWMSKRWVAGSGSGDYWYDTADWVAPSQISSIALTSGVSAWKITADTTPAVDDEYLFRTLLTVTSPTVVKIFWQADDEGTIYVDSKEAQTTTEANSTQYLQLGLSAGDHWITARVVNTINPQCGLTMAIVNAATNTVLRRTDNVNWKTHKVVGGVRPGMTAGAILRTLHDEAVTRGVYGSGLFTPDFDGELDSNGDAWPEIQEVGFPIGGTTNGDVIRHLEELGCESRVLPDGTWQAFIEQGADVSDTVRLQYGHNLLSLTYQGSPASGTKAYVRTLAGWVEATNAPGVSAYGVRETGIVSGTSLSTAQGQRLGNRTLAETAAPHYVYSATLRAVAGCVPFLSFGVGDTVMCLDRTDTYVPMVVLSLTASTPDDTPGPVTFTVELDLA